MYTHSFTQSWTVHVHANTQTYTNTHTHTETSMNTHRPVDCAIKLLTTKPLQSQHMVDFFKGMIMPQN